MDFSRLVLYLRLLPECRRRILILSMTTVKMSYGGDDELFACSSFLPYANFALLELIRRDRSTSGKTEACCRDSALRSFRCTIEGPEARKTGRLHSTGCSLLLSFWLNSFCILQQQFFFWRNSADDYELESHSKDDGGSSTGNRPGSGRARACSARNRSAGPGVHPCSGSGSPRGADVERTVRWTSAA